MKSATPVKGGGINFSGLLKSPYRNVHHVVNDPQPNDVSGLVAGMKHQDRDRGRNYGIHRHF